MHPDIWMLSIRLLSYMGLINPLLHYFVYSARNTHIACLVSVPDDLLLLASSNWFFLPSPLPFGCEGVNSKNQRPYTTKVIEHAKLGGRKGRLALIAGKYCGTGTCNPDHVGSLEEIGSWGIRRGGSKSNAKKRSKSSATMNSNPKYNHLWCFPSS